MQKLLIKTKKILLIFNLACLNLILGSNPRIVYAETLEPNLGLEITDQTRILIASLSESHRNRSKEKLVLVGGRLAGDTLLYNEPPPKSIKPENHSNLENIYATTENNRIDPVEIWLDGSREDSEKSSDIMEEIACPDDEILNPETGKCANLKTTSRKDCREGYERGMSGRCQKIKLATEMKYKIEPDPKVIKEEQSFNASFAILIILGSGLVYYGWEFREGLIGGIRRRFRPQRHRR